MIIGAHMSAPILTVPRRTVEIGGNAFQIFSHSPRTWKVTRKEREWEKFRAELKRYSAITYTMIHASYLINLASPKDEVWERSKSLLREEMKIAHELGLKYVNVHPGSRLNASEEEALKRCALAVKEVISSSPSDVTLLLENVSPKGGNIGWNFFQLAKIKELSHCDIKFTYDTCHGFDANYDVRTVDGVKKLIEEIGKTVGTENIVACHLNDSKYPPAIAKDRHERLARGYIGEKGFLNFFSHALFRNLPLILETPGGDLEHAEDITVAKRIWSLSGST